MNLWPLLLYFVLVMAVTGFMLGASYFLGPRHSDRATGEPYEAGIVSEGSARVRFPVKFYLVAMLFVIFDLEAAFIFAWAIAGRELGWPGYWAFLIFTLVLVLGLIYEWRLGALDWGSKKDRGLL